MTIIIENTDDPAEAKKSYDFDEIGRMIEKNNEMLEEILAISHKTKRYILTQQVMSVVKILLIVVPLILSIFYLTPLIKQAISPYQELLNPSGGANPSISNPISNLLK